MPNTNPLVDKVTQLRDAYASSTSAQTQVDGANAQLDFGANAPFVEVRLTSIITAIDTANGDEKYELEWQLSDSATFASGVVVANVLKVGDSSVTGSSADTVAGSAITNVVNNEWQGKRYRYGRIFQRIAGTTPSINWLCFATSVVPA